MMLTWIRINPGHYITDDDQFEIVRLTTGWEWTERPTGRSGIERSLRDAKESCWTGKSVSGRTTYND